MKTLIIYSSLTGNTKLVCEKAFEYLNGEKEIFAVEQKKEINFDEFDNVIVGTWVDRGTADAKARKFISELADKNVYFIATLGAAVDSDHGKKCIKNISALCSKRNNFVDGILARGKVSDDLKKKIHAFPLNIIHKFVPNIKKIVIEAEPHPNEEDFARVKDFIDRNFN
ncbi:MAG: flavodoxin [Fusobacterium sp.]|nr:flavodoxin [Fusobacterium sp.]